MADDEPRCRNCGCRKWEHETEQKQPGQACLCMSCTAWGPKLSDQARLERAEAVLRKHIARCRNVECGHCADVRAYFAEQERTA